MDEKAPDELVGRQGHGLVAITFFRKASRWLQTVTNERLFEMNVQNDAVLPGSQIHVSGSI